MANRSWIMTNYTTSGKSYKKPYIYHVPLFNAILSEKHLL